MIDQRVKIYFDYDISLDQEKLFIVETRPWEGKRYFAAPIQMVEYKHGVAPPPAFMPVATIEHIQDNLGFDSRQLVQAIMDAGWAKGVRPTGFQDHANELTAVRFHLEDMRLLAKVKK